MQVIEKYFRKKSNRVSFIELKNNIDDYKKYGISDIPLPIILDEMMDGVKTQEFSNEIKIEYIINGILFILAIDPEFLYIQDYKKIVSNLVKNPAQYALSKSAQVENDFETSVLFSRAAFLLDEENEMAAYNYARLLWNLDVDSKEKHVFVEQSVRILERVLNFNDKNPLANYELGNIYLATGDYVKAKSFYKRALEYTQVEELKEEIREKLVVIAPDVAVENAIYYLNRANNAKAIEELMEVRKNSTRYDISYYLAIAYMNSENIELSEKFFDEAIDKGADFAALFTDLVYVKYILNKKTEALHLANEAIEKYPAEIKLRYNRAIVFLSLGKNNKAIEDFDFILEYQDLSDELFNEIMKIKTSLEDR